MFALVDCNNFYVSCERVFDPKLTDRPVIVLSNNDGCAIARSEEAKVLGIAMGTPAFKLRQLIAARNIAVLSSNYALYGDMSRRVMQTLSGFTDQMEIYSIDEAFLELSGQDPAALADDGRKICTTVCQWTGIPVSVGIGPTKTLAKIANRLAKKSGPSHRVLSLIRPLEIQEALARTPVGDVWGIGPNYTRRLKRYGITTALALVRTDMRWIRGLMGVNGVRIVRELQGTACFRIETQPGPRKGVTVSRSFSMEIRRFDDLKTAVSAFTARGAEKLRADGFAAAMMLVFAAADRFKSPDAFFSATVAPALPTNDTPELIRCADLCLRQLYQPNISYKKAGVIFKDLVCASPIQTGLFDTKNRIRSQNLMRVIDRINAQMGRDTVLYGAAGLPSERNWQPLSRRRSPAYTTAWDQLPRAS